MKKQMTLAALLLMATCTFAQLKTTKLSIFKNGMFYQKKEGTLSVSNRTAYIPLPPNALLGTYWVTPGRDVKINQIEFRDDTLKSKRKIRTYADMLRYNIGKSINLRVQHGEKDSRAITGTLVDFYELNNMLKIKTNDGKMAIIFTQNIVDIDFDASMNDTYMADSTARRGKIYLDRATDNLLVNVVSMQTGIQWAPSYIIKLMNEKEARLVMKATIENAVEDIDGAEIDLVVGSPQMYYGGQQDPALTPMVRDNLSVWSYAGDNPNPSGKTRYLNKNMGLQNNTYYHANMQTLTGTYDGSGIDRVSENIIDEKGEEYNAEGEKIADLYFYKTGKINLHKNYKNEVPISSNNIPYKDVYEASIWDITNYEANRTVYQDPNNRIDVYHSIKLSNKTGAPITTALIFVLNAKEEPLAQDQITYTPANADAVVHLSKAIDVTVKNKEEEISKADKYKKLGKFYYDKVTLKGSIEVMNYQDKPIVLNVKKAVKGAVTKSDGGKATKSGKYIVLNPLTNMEWDVNLAANEKKTITYEYEVLITAGY
ncbi:MAG: hypothetical protein NTX03_13435 [Bacteroidetes bacterium]|nr:hypothetical protein [Bacteroidota bacterium]